MSGQPKKKKNKTNSVYFVTDDFIDKIKKKKKLDEDKMADHKNCLRKKKKTAEKKNSKIAFY